MSGRTRGALLLLVLLGGAALWYTRRPAPPASDAVVVARRGVTMRQVLSAADAQARGWDLTGPFHVTAGARALLRSGNNLIDVVSGSPLLAAPHPGLHDFCALGPGLVALSGATLLAYDGQAFQPVLRLPWADMHLVCGSDVIYAYGSGGIGGDVFALYPGGTGRKLVHVPEPILALAAAQDQRLYFSIWERIFTWAPGGQPALVMRVAEGAPITSLAFDDATGQLYFAAGEGVFELVDGAPELLVAGATGDLEFFDDTLFVKDRRERAILALSDLARPTHRPVERDASPAPFAPTEATPDPGSNEPGDAADASPTGGGGEGGSGSGPANCFNLPGEPPRPCLQAPGLQPTLRIAPAPVPVPAAPAAPAAPAVPAQPAPAATPR